MTAYHKLANAGNRISDDKRELHAPLALLQSRYDSSAATSTVEALVFALRRGLTGLQTIEVAGTLRPSTENARRLGAVDDAQLREICRRVQLFSPAVAPAWTPDDTKKLIRIWKRTR
jgi:hypothetical protein